MPILRIVAFLIAALVLLGGEDARVGGPPAAEAQTPGENGKIAYEINGGISVITLGTTGGTPLVAHGRLPAWSADGKKLAYVEDEKLVVIKQNGTKLMDISVGVGMSDPSWSPDGNHIVFGSSSDLYTVEVGQTTLFNLTNITNTPSVVEQEPDWGALGARIAFVESNPNVPHRRLGLLSVAGGAVTFVSGAEGLIMPSWSPDEATFAFTRRPTLPQSAGEVSPQGDFADIFVVSANGGTPTNITNTAVSIQEYSPTWSPDGTKIAYVHDEDANEKIRTMNPNGSGKADVTFGVNPAWQPIRKVIAGVEFTQGIQDLQTVFELQSDLAGDNQPPVPIVAGKPAVMRVYFEEVLTQQSYTIEVDSQQDSLTLQPGCKPEQRRKQENNCKSVDFYFTPPSGNWSKQLVVKDFANDVVFDETFDLVSDDSDSLVVKAVGVCDDVGSGLLGQWQCQDPSGMFQLTSLLRRLLPTDNVSVLLTGDQVRREVSDFPLPAQWWSQVQQDLSAMYGINDSINAGLGQETVYYGLARHLALTGGLSNAAALNSHAAASKPTFTTSGYDATQWIVASGIGNAMGLHRSPTALPTRAAGLGCWAANANAAPWPYADNMLRSGPAPGEIEVGFDVANQTALPGDLFYDVMGFCTAPPPSSAPGVTAWISPFSTVQLLQPVGPLGSGPITPQGVPASVAGDFWLVSGFLDGSSANFDPLITLALDAPTDVGSGTHRIEVRDSGDAVLFTRLFTPTTIGSAPLPGEEAPEEASAFFEMIPVQAGAASIQIFDAADGLVGQITLGGEAPSVEIDAPQVSASGTAMNVSWTVTDADSTEHTYRVDYSADGGLTWLNQAMGLTEAGLALDPAVLAGSDEAVVRIVASDGVNSGEAVSALFSVGGKLPHGEIIGPSATKFRSGNLVWLEAAAWDVDDGTLDDGVTWSSSRDGNLGNGASLPVYDLSVGTHTVTMTVQDSDDNVVTDTIQIRVTDTPLVEGEEPGIDRLWGDVNCDDAVDIGDAISLARSTIGASTGQQPGCPEFGAGVEVGGSAETWGDLDCGEDQPDIGHAIMIARHSIGLTPNFPGCPVLGTTVSVKEP